MKTKKSIIQPTISVKTTREPKGLKGVCCSNPSIKVDFITDSKGKKVPYEFCTNCATVFKN